MIDLKGDFDTEVEIKNAIKALKKLLKVYIVNSDIESANEVLGLIEKLHCQFEFIINNKL